MFQIAPAPMDFVPLYCTEIAMFAKTKERRRDGTVVGRENCTSMMFNEAIGFIRHNRRLPFFVYLAPMSPHPPLLFPAEYQPMYLTTNGTRSRRSVLVMIKEFDEGVGRLMRAVSELDLEEDTMVVFLNDNGGPLTFPGINNPLRGYKGDLYEGGTRVTYYAQWPGVIPAGVKVDVPVSSLDILPTIREIVGSDRYQDAVLDGTSWLQLVQGNHTIARNNFWGRPLFWRFDMECQPLQKAIRLGHLKWIQIGSGTAELYNLTRDISESHDIAASHPNHMLLFYNMYASWAKQLPPISNRKPVPVGQRPQRIQFRQRNYSVFAASPCEAAMSPH